MKLKFAILAAALFASAPAAKADVLLSNLGEPKDSYFPISFWWAGNHFITDGSASSFLLDGVTLSMDAASATPGSFFVAIYSDGMGAPGTLLETLSGAANPATAGNYTYTSAGFSLAPNTSYWVVAGVEGAAAPGGSGYHWNNAGPAVVFTGPWTIPSLDTHITSFAIEPGDGGGANWNNFDNDGYARQFSVSATPVPEPSVCALVGLGAAALLYRRRKRA